MLFIRVALVGLGIKSPSDELSLGRAHLWGAMVSGCTGCVGRIGLIGCIGRVVRNGWFGCIGRNGHMRSVHVLPF